MSEEARRDLIHSSHLFFQNQAQIQDLLNPQVTQTWLIALLQCIVAKGFYLELTAVKSDHHDDSALGLRCHYNGYAVDCWPLNTPRAGDYLDATDPRFQTFLGFVSRVPYLYQIGLAGSADIQKNEEAAGATYFSDDGGDHVHLGAKEPT